MATPIQFPSEAAQRIYALLEANQVALLTQDGMLCYGDQNRVPVTPTVCVESGPTARALAGVPRRTENTLTCYILLYWAKVQDNQTDKLAAEQCAEGIARYIDTLPTLELNGDGGVVIHGHITDIDPGYSLKGTAQSRTLYQAVRLTWTGKTKTILGA
jgi:hypothetical protein